MSEPNFSKSTHKPAAKIGQAGASKSVANVDYQKVNVNMNKQLKGLIDIYIAAKKHEIDGLNMSVLLSKAVREYMKKHPA